MRKEERRRLLQRYGRKGGKLLSARMTKAERVRRARMAAMARARIFAFTTFQTAAKKLLAAGRLIAAEIRAGRLPAAKQERFLRTLEALQADLQRLLQPQRSNQRKGQRARRRNKRDAQQSNAK